MSAFKFFHEFNQQLKEELDAKHLERMQRQEQGQGIQIHPDAIRREQEFQTDLHRLKREFTARYGVHPNRLQETELTRYMLGRRDTFPSADECKQ